MIRHYLHICLAGLLLFALGSCRGSNMDDSGTMPWDKDLDDKPEAPRSEAVVGEPLPAWEEGYLDIHAVNTGRGECTFFIMPDGTTLVVDAGEIASKSSDYDWVAQRPDADTRAYVTYARYMSHFLPEVAGGKLDYFLVTHFHIDHFGTRSDKFETVNGYHVTGMMGLYSLLRFNKLIDRAWPDYSDEALKTSDFSTSIIDYRTFVDYNKTRGLTVEKFDLGSKSQIAMVHKPGDYDFEISNVAANGLVWNGSEGVDAFGTANHSENGSSCSIYLRYGDFDYLTCGDGGQNGRIENPLAQQINHRLEAMKAHHHMSVNTMTNTSMAIFKPMVVVTQSFYVRPEDQPNASVFGNLLSTTSFVGEKNFYFTNIDPSVQASKATLYSNPSVKSTGGHVVIRVAPGGGSFYVYVLDDTDTKYTVKQIDGPFICIH